MQGEWDTSSCQLEDLYHKSNYLLALVPPTLSLCRAFSILLVPAGAA